jgi:protein TonB
MTPTEILSANLLEILFEHRNKQYGAYTLRKFYNNRLLVALVVSFSAVFLIMSGIGNLQKSEELLAVFNNEPEVTIRTIETERPKQEVPKPPKAPTVSRQVPTAPYTAPLIVANTPTNTIATQDALDKLDVGIKPSVGDEMLGIATPPDGPIGTAVAVVTPPEPPVEVFKPLERQPEFPGGQAAWIAFLNRYLQSPEELEAGERKSVSVRFWVSEDGSVTAFEVLKSGGRAFDNEVVRVLKKMPKWKPAIQNGRPVATGFTQPVTFTAIEE